MAGKIISFNNMMYLISPGNTNIIVEIEKPNIIDLDLKTKFDKRPTQFILTISVDNYRVVNGLPSKVKKLLSAIEL